MDEKKLAKRKELAGLEAQGYNYLYEISNLIHKYRPDNIADISQKFYDFEDWWDNYLDEEQRRTLEDRGLLKDAKALGLEFKNFREEIDNSALSDAINALGDFLDRDPEDRAGMNPLAKFPYCNIRLWLVELEEYRRKQLLDSVGK